MEGNWGFILKIRKILWNALEETILSEIVISIPLFAKTIRKFGNDNKRKHFQLFAKTIRKIGKYHKSDYFSLFAKTIRKLERLLLNDAHGLACSGDGRWFLHTHTTQRFALIGLYLFLLNLTKYTYINAEYRNAHKRKYTYNMLHATLQSEKEMFLIY